MNDSAIITALSLVPRNRVTRAMGTFARSALPRPLHRAFLRWYIDHYGVDMEECVGGIDDFRDFTEFFTRPLRPGLRPVCEESDALVSPCDGKVYTCGRIEGGQLSQGEGMPFSAAELLGGDAEPDAARFDGGQYIIIYLSPRDYHRVHVPREGEVTRYHYVPGELWPVFPAATRTVDGLFARNERLTGFLHTDRGEIALAMIGAFGVGRIKVTFADTISNQGTPRANVTLPTPATMARCGEFGRFEMGSTVILLLPPPAAGQPELRWDVAPGEPVRLGQRLGAWGTGA